MTTGQSVALPNFSTGMIIERGVNGTAYNYLKYQNTIRFFVFWGKKYGSAHINRAGTIYIYIFFFFIFSKVRAFFFRRCRDFFFIRACGASQSVDMYIKR